MPARRRVSARDDRAAALWADARRDAGWNAEKAAELTSWLKDHPERAELLRRHEALLDDAALVWATQRVAARSQTPRGFGAFRRGRLFQPVMAAGLAAVAGVVVLAGVGLAPRGDRLVGKRGETQPIALADGSAVRLNGLSEVQVELGESERRLRLKGEGFFEVAPDKTRPFSVEVDGVRVTAVGTRFNVDQRPKADGAAIEVVVFEGAVDVRSNRGISMRVRAGERAVVSRGVIQRAVLAHPEVETDVPSWAKGWLEFNDATLVSVVEDLERASGVRVELADPAVARVLVSGRLASDQPENALAAMVGVHGLTLTRKGTDQFVISKS
ncbi:transmembrane sensor [Brevundimonas faecalis]|uniref:Transmembrane sensor n=1 Tax=Brevundimonas faecalis TaxID=947378 RepID=A0ABV2RG98_9CAUL